MHPMSFGNYNGRIALHVLRMQDKIGDFMVLHLIMKMGMGYFFK